MSMINGGRISCSSFIKLGSILRTALNELCHEKTDLQIFVAVIPQEGLADEAHQSFFWYDTDYEFIICSLHGLYFQVGVIPKEELAGPRLPILLLI